MPLLTTPDYRAPAWLPGRHAQTIYPSLFRQLPDLEQLCTLQRLRINTADKDFLDLDWGLAATLKQEQGKIATQAKAGKLPQAKEAEVKETEAKAGKRAVILCHGLEGDSRRAYIRGMGLTFMRAGWDMLAWNFRSCSGEMNFTPRLYHSGETEDLRAVIAFALQAGYCSLVLIGFSMGGNQVLKLLGESGEALPPEVKGGVAVSVPCDLTDSCKALAQGFNRVVYMGNFLKTLKCKMLKKHQRWPKLFKVSDLDAVRDFKAFDDRFTAPLHGFASAEDYWRKSSSRQFISGIRRPVLLINAANDPFLQGGCYPRAEAQASEYLFLEIPRQGGHVGFTPRKLVDDLFYWTEQRALQFVKNFIE